ncbi:MAG: NAD(P)-dependent oxidoreductase [Phycisphaeraceae bacterium]|jgi:nucleoside-diphosphate-sugar epimerase|nr:NAD(P)-dependent oxidoreductase [Phycisphaeraceae bacterium]
MNPGKVAITGGSGRVGFYMVEYFRDKADVTVIDNRPPEQQDVDFVETDILDFESIEAALSGHEAVVHLAAIPNPRVAPADVTFNTNVQGTWNVLQAAENAGVRRVAVASSDAATGLHYNEQSCRPQYLPVDEAHPLRPMEFYSRSKEVVEVISRHYASRGKLEVVVIRPTHIVFPPEWPELEARGVDVNNYHLWSYVEPDDVAQGFYLALTVQDTNYDVFFISAEDTLCSRPTLEMIHERFGELPEVRDPELFERKPRASILDISRARRVLGFEPKSDWRRLFARVPVENRMPPKSDVPGSEHRGR